MATLFTGSILRLIVTAGTLAAVYFFIVNPILDTTTDAIDKATESSSQLQREIQGDISDSLKDAGVNQVDLPKQSLKRAEKMLNCINKANGDVGKISACTSKFS